MKKTSLLTIICAVLLLSNLALAAALLFRRPSPPAHGGPRDLIIERLGFDGKQVALYDSLIRRHRDDIRSAESEIRIVKNELYGSLVPGTGKQDRDSLIRELGLLQRRIETIHYRHFEEIRTLCRPGQMDEFAALTRDMAALFDPKRPKP